MLQGNSNDNISLIFSLQGNFIQREDDIDFNTLPIPVTNSIEKNFSDYNHGDQAELIALKNKEIHYLIDFNSEDKKFEVLFNSQGTIVCQNP